MVATSILRSARFARLLGDHAGTDMEVRVWVETGFDPVQVAVWWEPTTGKFWFPVLDALGRDRLGLVVFKTVPCVDSAALVREEAQFVANVLPAMAGAAEGTTLTEIRSHASKSTDSVPKFDASN
ncbi:MAG: hypothetical protein ACYDDF_00530 [Thermoplasmatota archaeon]